jgi:hypothetical protein
MSIQGEAIPMTQLCASCFTASSQDLDTLLSKPGDGRKGYSWTTTRKRLHASSALGCPLCTIIFNHTLKCHCYKVPDSWTNAELIEKWKAGDEAMPFCLLYSQHLEAESESRDFEDICILPDMNRGGEGSAIVSIKDSYFLFCASWLQHHVLPAKLTKKLTSWRCSGLMLRQKKVVEFILLYFSYIKVKLLAIL